MSTVIITISLVGFEEWFSDTCVACAEDLAGDEIVDNFFCLVQKGQVSVNKTSLI